jgi:hypothetical protein
MHICTRESQNKKERKRVEGRQRQRESWRELEAESEKRIDACSDKKKRQSKERKKKSAELDEYARTNENGEKEEGKREKER